MTTETEKMWMNLFNIFGWKWRFGNYFELLFPDQYPISVQVRSITRYLGRGKQFEQETAYDVDIILGCRIENYEGIPIIGYLFPVPSYRCCRLFPRFRNYNELEDVEKRAVTIAQCIECGGYVLVTLKKIIGRNCSCPCSCNVMTHDNLQRHIQRAWL